MKTAQTLKQGTPVLCNGYKGAIVRHYDGDQYEIRLPGGEVCTDDFHVIDNTQASQDAAALIDRAELAISRQDRDLFREIAYRILNTYRAA